MVAMRTRTPDIHGVNVSLANYLIARRKCVLIISSYGRVSSHGDKRPLAKSIFVNVSEPNIVGLLLPLFRASV